MSVPLYTTPTITLTFTGDIDLTQADAVFVTFFSNRHALTKTGEALTVLAKSIAVTLTQEETAAMADRASIQANWMIGGKRVATEIAEIDFSDQLLTEVIDE